MKTLVGLLGSAETGKHTLSPGATAIHGGVDAPGERILSRQPEILVVIHVGDVKGRVETINGLRGGGHVRPFVFRLAGQGLL